MNFLEYFKFFRSNKAIFRPLLSGSRFFSGSKHVLPDLPYDYHLHHNKHHRAYVTNFNLALEKYNQNDSSVDLATRVNLLTLIKFHGGGHINHSLYWQNLLPPKEGGGKIVDGSLVDAIKKQWGSVDQFIQAFNSHLSGIQGSGWCWLVKIDPSRKLFIQTTMNQDLVTQGKVILGIDAWEHAYYVQYFNDKVKYFENIWNEKVVNWKIMNQRFEQ
ncbi:hypothetical protein PORY_001623 [Pneumocystis oryctolagi]|uniref:Uncharacterized protein n=1 Tax=Pneumocystis oryctolagi TaxID=42067 RepID=A0ACB7CBK0_9ASCO|nr:hypothetical protein PORY_001623 [Pneumocystis oryctolagi]